MTKIRDRDQVIDAAARLFGEKGFEATRIEEIAAELGILKGSLYYYAGSKAELLFLVTRKRLLGLIEIAERIAASNARPTDKLATVLREHLHQLDRHHPESSQWFVQPRSRPAGEAHKTEMQALNRDYERVLRGIVREGVAAGEFRPDLDVTVATLGILGACNWLTRWYHPDGRLTIDQIGDTLIPLVLGGLCHDPPPAATRPATRKRAKRAGPRTNPPLRPL